MCARPATRKLDCSGGASASSALGASSASASQGPVDRRASWQGFASELEFPSVADVVEFPGVTAEDIRQVHPVRRQNREFVRRADVL
ncbi:MAG: hypothetical protein OXC26_14910 [Albidovulum sp.]|nr:hypothetical protein [Albidovulum sp.]